MSTVTKSPEMSRGECERFIIAKLGNKGRNMLKKMRHGHNKALLRQHGVRPTCTAANAARALEEDIRALALALKGE